MRAAKQSGAAALTVSSILRGVFEIAGKSSPYQEILGWAGITLVFIGAAGTVRIAVRERRGWL